MINDLDRGKAAFETWRKTRKGKKAKIPDELWDLACELEKKYGNTKVAQTLRLNSSTLKKKISTKADLGKPKKTFPKKTRKATPKKIEKSVEVIKLAPINLAKSKGPETPQPKSRPTIIAEIIGPSGTSIRFFSGIDNECLKTLAHMIEGV